MSLAQEVQHYRVWSRIPKRQWAFRCCPNAMVAAPHDRAVKTSEVRHSFRCQRAAYKKWMDGGLSIGSYVRLCATWRREACLLSYCVLAVEVELQG